MSKALCVVPVADLESGEKRRVWELPPEWLSWALSDTEATPRGAPGSLDVTLGLNGREVIVRGRLHAALQMPCGRTLDPVEVDVEAEVFLMLEPPRGGAQGVRRGTNRRRQSREKPEEPELSPEEAARDSYDGENVVLDDFAREFLLLDLPMSPMRSDLRSDESPTISGAPGGEDPGARGPRTLDPRLAPLAEIARRLRDKE